MTRPSRAPMLALALTMSLLFGAAGEAQAPPPHLAPLAEAIDGRNTIRRVPAQPRAIVYLFHGSGGSETFATRLHSRRVLARLEAAGYAYLAAASGDRGPPARWDLRSLDPGANADVAFMLATHEALIRRGEIRRDTPVFTMGMSNGGGFANLFAVAAKAKGLPVRAVADYMGPIPAPARAASADYPDLFLVVAENDGLVSAATVTTLSEGLAAKGARVERRLVREGRVTPDTFRALEGLDDAARRGIVQHLVAKGVIDAEGRRLVFRDRPALDRPEMASLAGMMPPGPQARDIMNELLIAWAGHQMRSDFAEDQVRFFDAALSR